MLYLFAFQIMFSTAFSCTVFYIQTSSQTLNRVKLLIAEGVKEMKRQKEGRKEMFSAEI